MRSPLICREDRSITPGLDFAQGTTQSIAGFTGDYQTPRSSLSRRGGRENAATLRPRQAPQSEQPRPRPASTSSSSSTGGTPR